MAGHSEHYLRGQLREAEAIREQSAKINSELERIGEIEERAQRLKKVLGQLRWFASEGPCQQAQTRAEELSQKWKKKAEPKSQAAGPKRAAQPSQFLQPRPRLRTVLRSSILKSRSCSASCFRSRLASLSTSERPC